MSHKLRFILKSQRKFHLSCLLILALTQRKKERVKEGEGKRGVAQTPASWHE